MLSLSLYEKKDNDKIITVDDIEIFLDEGVDDFPADISIFKDKDRFGGGLNAKFLAIKYEN